MADQKHAFLIDGVEYPLPTMFRLGDPVLVRDVTGMEWDEFGERNAETKDDPIVLLGLLAVAVAQRNTTWKRDRVQRFVEQLDFSAIDVVGGNRQEEPQLPPADGGAHESLNGSASSSDADTDPVTTQLVPGAL